MDSFEIQEYQMDNHAISDEIEALNGILCSDREFEVQSIGDKEVVLVIRPQQIRNHLVELTVVLDTKSYPSSSPQLSVQCPKLNRIELENINSRIAEESSKLRGEVAILPLVEWLVEYIRCYVETATERTESLSLIDDDVGDGYTVVVQLDHIRSRTIYVKTLSQWFRELDLHAALVFYRKWIFLMVSGSKDGIQVYLKRHRTRNVDIDSGGRPCKERLLSVLGQIEGPFDAGIAAGVRLDQVELNDSGEDWSTYWKSRSSLTSIYQKFIQPQTGQKK